jgi:signal peptidase I
LVLIGALVGIAAFATGQISVAMTRGISMLPRIHTGDLVVLRAAGSYHVGEIVDYESPLLHAGVLHRIIAEHDGLFTFKGDHITFADTDRLPASSIRGTLLFVIPSVGKLSAWLKNPIHSGLSAATLALILVALAGRARRTATLRSRRARHLAPRSIGGPGWVVLSALTVACFGLLTLVSLCEPTTRSSRVAIRYTEGLSFGYSATTKPGTAYPNGKVLTGVPVFVDLVQNLDVAANYHFDATAKTTVSGTIVLTAKLVEPDGWSRVLATSPLSSFNGRAASATVKVPLQEAVDLVQQLARETKDAQGNDSVVITPTVFAKGTVAGKPFTTTMTPSLVFQFNPIELNLLAWPGNGATPLFPQLDISHSGAVHTYTEVPVDLVVLGHQFNLRIARLVGESGSAAALLLSLVAVIRFWRRRGVSEEERTRRRVRHDLVLIESDPSSVAGTVIDVAKISALTDLADRFDVAVLDYADGPHHVYFASIGEILYRYRAAPASNAREFANNVIPLRDGTRQLGTGDHPPGSGDHSAKGSAMLTATPDAQKSARTQRSDGRRAETQAWEGLGSDAPPARNA